jgi:arginyl-tRNA synthetase
MILEAQEMLLKVRRAGDEEVIHFGKKWKWVYDGFATTYKNLQVDFDCCFTMNKTYLLRKVIQV